MTQAVSVAPPEKGGDSLSQPGIFPAAVRICKQRKAFLFVPMTDPRSHSDTYLEEEQDPAGSGRYELEVLLQLGFQCLSSLHCFTVINHTSGKLHHIHALMHMFVCPSKLFLHLCYW